MCTFYHLTNFRKGIVQLFTLSGILLGTTQANAQFTSDDGVFSFTNFTDLDPKEELIANADGQPLNFGTPGGINCALTSVLAREYDVQWVKGDPGSCDISLDLTQVSGYNHEDRIMLLLDPERDGYDVRPIPGTVIGNTVQWYGIHLMELSTFRVGEAVLAYYSVASGNVFSASWSPVPGGSAQIPHDFCEYIDMIVSAGTTISLQANTLTTDNVVIESGAVLDVNGSSGWKTISVHGDWTNDGTFSTLQVIVDMVGSEAQYINGVSQEMSKLVVSNPNGVFITAPDLRVKRGIEFNNNGVLYTNDALTLGSNSQRTAYIEELNDGDVIGEITMERYHDASTGWFILSSAVAGTTVADWNDDLTTTGFTGSDFPATSFVSIQSYDETISGPRDMGYVPVADVNEALVPKRGYFVYANAGPVMVSVKGEPFKGNQSLPVSYTPNGFGSADGWSLVANPYPSNIDWDAPSGWVKQNVFDAIYMYNASTGGYATYINGVGNNGGSPIIASSQGFYVRSQANPVLSTGEAVKTKNTADFKSADNTPALVSLHVNSLKGHDAFTIAIDDNTDSKFNANNDAVRMPAIPGTLCTGLMGEDGEEFAIKRLPLDAGGIHVPIALQIPESGFVSFSVEVDDVKGCSVRLEDLRTGSSYLLNDAHEAFVELQGGRHDGRFMLHIEKSHVNMLQAESTFTTVVPDPNGIWISASSEMGSNASVQVFNALGQEIANLNLLQPGNREFIPIAFNGQIIVRTILDGGKGYESINLVK